MSDQPDEILTIDELDAHLKVCRTVYRLAASDLSKATVDAEEGMSGI